MNDLFGTLLDELTIKINCGHLVWEEKLKLYLRPKPVYIPIGLWSKLVRLVLLQVIQKGEFRNETL